MLTALALAGLSMPVFAGKTQRIIIDLPLPRAALEYKAGSSASDGETLARLAPAISPRAPTVILPSAASPEPVISPGSSGTTASPEDLEQLHLRLGDGQSLYLLFKHHHLSQADLATMLSSSRKAKRLLSRLQPGQKITLWVTGKKRVEKLILETPGPTDMLLSRTPSGYGLSKQRDDQPEPAAPVQRVTEETPPIPAKTMARTDEQTVRGLQAIVKPGDSLYLIFSRNNIPPRDLAQLMSVKGSKALKRLRPGQRLDLQLGRDNGLLALQMRIDETRTLHARRSAGGFSLKITTRPLDRRITTAGAIIESSLFLAGQRAGLSDPVIMQMVEIFGWDIDFALEIRAGDRFTLIYEELYREGKKIRDGKILAAEFFNRGRSIRALRYVDASGRKSYYSPKGLSMRKAFLRTPISFARISSRFNLRRKHPVLNRIRAHKGVDYAARRGTPIKAAGDGRVLLAGWKGGYGRTVILQHGGKYSTLYGHMSRLHKRTRKGKRVYQGQVIGYVGSTGLATGPHLHYEFRVRGVHKDPLRVKLPKALPIERQYKADFIASSKPLIARLDRLATTSLAGNP